MPPESTRSGSRKTPGTLRGSRIPARFSTARRPSVAQEIDGVRGNGPSIHRAALLPHQRPPLPGAAPGALMLTSGTGCLSLMRGCQSLSSGHELEFIRMASIDEDHIIRSYENPHNLDPALPAYASAIAVNATLNAPVRRTNSAVRSGPYSNGVQQRQHPNQTLRDLQRL